MQVKGLSAQKIVHSCTIFCAYEEQEKGQRSEIEGKRYAVRGKRLEAIGKWEYGSIAK